MATDDGSENDYNDMHAQLIKQFEGVSDDQFLAEIQENYENDSGGMSVAQYYELDRRRDEEGLDVAGYDTRLAELIAAEETEVAETMAGVAESFRVTMKDFGLPTFESRVDLPSFEVPNWADNLASQDLDPIERRISLADPNAESC